MERQGERDDQVQSKGGTEGRKYINVQGGRESYVSRGSEDEIKEAIQKYTSDEKMQKEIKHLLH